MLQLWGPNLAGQISSDREQPPLLLLQSPGQELRRAVLGLSKMPFHEYSSTPSFIFQAVQGAVGPLVKVVLLWWPRALALLSHLVLFVGNMRDERTFILPPNFSE